jgi:benzodiazapine receptor
MTSAYNWYQELKKPSWAPPSWLFGPVWTALYILIAISFGYAGWMFLGHEIPFIIILPFILNLVFNFSFTAIQFKLKKNFLAAIDILLVLATLIWAMFAIYKYASWVALINIPYFLWVTFATVLQLTITYLNRRG